MGTISLNIIKEKIHEETTSPNRKSLEVKGCEIPPLLWESSPIKVVKKGKLNQCIDKYKSRIHTWKLNSFWSEGSKEVQFKRSILKIKKDQNAHNKEEGKISIKMLSWNCHSLSTDKTVWALNQCKEVLLLQEIWNPNKNSLHLLGNNVIIKKRNEDPHGGTLISLPNELKVNKKSFDINGDSTLGKIIVAGNRYIILGSMYINHSTLKSIRNSFYNLRKQIPQEEKGYVVIAGDWNVDSTNINDKKFKLLHRLAKEEGWNVMSAGKTHGNKGLDFIIYGSQINIKEIETIPDTPSDHQAVKFIVEVEQPSKSTKRIEVQNKKAIEKITLEAMRRTIEEGQDADRFLKLHNELRLKTKLTKVVKLRKGRDNESLLESINKLRDEDKDIDLIISDIWKDKWLRNQDQRWSNESKEAFDFMRKVTKYNQFEKRDGSIVSKIQLPNGSIINDSDKVNKQIIEQLKKVQTLDSEAKYSEEIPFPKLPRITSPNKDSKNRSSEFSEIERLMKKMSINKATSYDGLSDKIFRMKAAGKVLSTIWEYDSPDPIYNQTKLLALNKLHPNIPGPKDFRPINIMPQGIKFREVRFAEKLYQYLSKDLHPSQTGFVPGMGCLINQVRAINRIKMRTENPSGGKLIYGLFLDFSSAYNTILHSKLFKCLKGILDDNEIEYMRALYSRNTIRLGKYSFKPNIGVAQGSTISPALFNIYSEELLYKVEEIGISREDIFAYADDILILCTSLDQIKKVAQVIRKWSLENNLFLNEKKSGIVPFQSRMGKDKSEFSLFESKIVFSKKTQKQKVIKTPKHQSYDGFPVLNKYKYLGLWLDYRLGINHQLNHIRNKVNYISGKLYPLLQHCSLESRINLWELMCRPLIEQTYALFDAEDSESNKLSLIRVARMSFKKMTLLAQNVRNRIIEKFSGKDFITQAKISVEKAKANWARRSKKLNHPYTGKNSMESRQKNLMPKELVNYTNLLTAKCKLCEGKIANVTHLHDNHQISLPEPEDLWDDLNEVLVNRENNKGFQEKTQVDRKETIKRRALIVQSYITQIQYIMGSRSQS